MTLELREWCERMVVVRWRRHGVEGALMVFMLSNVLSQLMMLLWLRNVADRRRGDTDICCVLVGVRRREVLAPPKLEPRRWLRFVSHVTTELVLE